VSVFVSTPPNGHDSVCIKGAELRKPRIFREPKTGELQISFQLAIDPSTNSEFMMREFGNDVMIYAESSPELLSAEEELPGDPAQKDMDFPEIAADPKRVKKGKKKASAESGEQTKPKKARTAKPGQALPRDLGTQRRKPIPKPKDRKHKKIALTF
jgi:hypothetical protein